MSRLAKKPIHLPENINYNFKNNTVELSNNNGSLKIKIPAGIILSFDEKSRNILVNRQSNEKKAKALQGTIWSLIRNAVEGLVNKFTKELEIIGIGYNAKIEGNTLVLNIGYGHPIKVAIPPSLDVKCLTNTLISIKGIDKQEVGQFAVNIKNIRPINVYTLKGIRFRGEVVKQKPGKAVATGAGGVKK